MKELGVIVNIGDETSTIEMLPQAGCSSCSLCKGVDVRHLTIGSSKVKGLAIGDRVEVEVNESQMLKVYMLLYMVPLLVFSAAIVLFYMRSHSPVISFIAALCLVIVTYMFIGSYVKRRLRFLTDIKVKPRLMERM